MFKKLPSLLATQLLLALLLGSAPAFGQYLAEWEMSGANGAASMLATTTDSGMETPTMSLGSGLVPFNYGPVDGFEARWCQATSLSQAIATDEYFTFTLEPKNGKEFSVTGISLRPFSQNRSRTFTVFSSVNGFTSGQELGSISYSGNTGSVTLESVTVSGHNDLTTPVEFRIYVYAAIDNQWEAFGFASTQGVDFQVVGASADAGGATYDLTIAASNGSVTKVPDLVSYAAGDTVTLTATPSGGYQFDNWTGDLGGTENPKIIVMDGNKAVAANFIVAAVPDPPPVSGSATNMLATRAHNGDIRLRWAIADAQAWKASLQYGCTISRMTTKRNGQPLSLGDQAASREVIRQDVKPLGEGTWPTGDQNQAAHDIIYGIWPVEGEGFAAAVSQQENDENRFFFAHALADQSFWLAQRLGLSMVDTSAVAGEEYLYTVRVNNFTTFAGHFLTGSARGGLELEVDSLVAVTDLSVINGDTAIVVGWSVAETEHLYTRYDIYRAPTGTSGFVKVNEAPFLYGYNGDEDPKYAFFTDSVATFGTYDYYVVGHTPFDITGPNSAIVTAVSKPPALNLRVRIDSIPTTENSLEVHWTTTPSDLNGQLASHRIYRANSVKGPYTLMTVSDLPPERRSWVEPQVQRAAYYYVETEDVNGHVYTTPPVLGQPNDATPPAIPAGFGGSDDGSGVITLDWNANHEEDLKGYRIYRCFMRGGDFAEVTDEIITTTSWTDDLEGTIVNDTVFYRILAEDQRANRSEMGPVLRVARADITPPAPPVLSRATATPRGIALSWEYSGSDDVVRHELQRRRAGSPTWDVVATITPGSEADFLLENFDAGGAINFLDESPLDRDDYSYQFLAFDDSDLSTGSEIITLRPFDDGLRAAIEDLRVEYLCTRDSTAASDLGQVTESRVMSLLQQYEDNGTISDTLRKTVVQALLMGGHLTNEDLADWLNYSSNDLYTNVLALQSNTGAFDLVAAADNCDLTLTWTYDLDPSVLHFQVLRSRRQSRLRPYRALPVAYFFPGSPPTGPQFLAFTDEDVTPGVRYVYKIIAVHTDGSHSQPGPAVTVVVE